MAESIETDELRESAQNWNLEGDRKLLNLLQNIHQNITSRCTETNKKLNEMFMSLDHAKVSMDNVNNRFMSLSNTQFVESRVYEDDPGFVTPLPAAKPKQEENTNISGPHQRIAAALRLIENNHERVTILDDSDSDTDDEGASVILRPKDVYQTRPLPFIIGSQSWKNKWHAGLIAEDSDSESMESKKDEDLSESDESVAMSSVPNIHADANSFRSVSPASLPVQDDLYKPDMSNVYRSFAATNNATHPYLFADEPPPIDNDTDAPSIKSDPESDTDDIFSELHKDLKKAVQKNNIVRSESKSDCDKKELSNNNRVLITPDVNKTNSLDLYHNSENDKFDNECASDKVIESDKHLNQSNTGKGGSSKNISVKAMSEDGVEDRRPTGAVSLFGTKSAADTIGAAILKRNQRKSSSSEDDDEKTNSQANTTQFNQNNNKINDINSGNKDILNKNITQIERARNSDNNNHSQNVIEQIVNKKNKGDKQIIVTDKNIFDELFAKSKQNTLKAKENTSKAKEETKSVKKVDVFSDIFDDIDNIFTSNVKIDKNTSKNIKKSIFDDILSEDTGETGIGDKQKTKSIFDDNSDLFKEPVKKPESKIEEKSQKYLDNDKLAAEVTNNDNAITKTGDSSDNTKLISTNDDQDLFKNDTQLSKTIKRTLTNTHAENKKLVSSIFDSDSDDGDIFSVIKAPDVKKTVISKIYDDDIIAEISNAVDNSSSKLSKDNLPLDNNSDIVKNNEKSKYGKNIENKQGNDHSALLFNKTFTEEPSKELDTESNKPITNTDRNTLEITKADRSQNNNLDQQYNNEECTPFDSTEPNDVLLFDTQESINASTNIPNTAKNYENTNMGDSQGTAAGHLQDFKNVSNKSKDKTQNENNTSNIPKSIDIQSNITKTSELNTSKMDEQIDNLKELQRDTFEDIFPEEPPEFEKAKESKSNQNVNALFGDDSEDENLFFKKETLISDEKPDNTQVQTIDPLFGVFRDEPPDFDDDFLFKTPTHSAIKKPVEASNNDELFSDSPKINNPESKTKSIDKKTDKDKEPIDNIKEKDRSNILESKSDVEETDGNTVEQNKPIGKLKPINFNINVANLLPGASPKKVVKPAEPPHLPSDVSLTDGGVITKLAEDKIFSDKSIEAKVAEPVLVKSVSFDSDPESIVLDNKISKERARIQVKRRPSTRQARKDAARKSVIEFNESTDTVDSNFETDSIATKYADEQTLQSSVEKNKSFDNTAINIDNKSIHAEILMDNESLEKGSPDKTNNSNNTSIKIISPNTDIFTDINLKYKTIDKPDITKISDDIVENSPENSSDNFNVHCSRSQEDSTQVLSINDDDIYIFREPKLLNDDLVETKITTLGQVYHENEAKDMPKPEKGENLEKSKSIFDDDDDDLLFAVGNVSRETLPKPTKSNVKPSIFEESNSLFLQKSKTLHNTESSIVDEQHLFSTGNSKNQIRPKTTKSSIFDDEDEELFSSGNTKPPKGSVKKSLFDDLSDDENLFGGKYETSTKHVSKSNQSGLFTSKLNKKEQNTLKTTLFDDDLDDLFGASSKGEKDTKSLSSNADVIQKTEGRSENFDDPLYMFKNDS